MPRFLVTLTAELSTEYPAIIEAPTADDIAKFPADRLARLVGSPTPDDVFGDCSPRDIDYSRSSIQLAERHDMQYPVECYVFNGAIIDDIDQYHDMCEERRLRELNAPLPGQLKLPGTETL